MSPLKISIERLTTMVKARTEDGFSGVGTGRNKSSPHLRDTEPQSSTYPVSLQEKGEITWVEIGLARETKVEL